ncbi:alpha/beta hydrolase family protein [Nocardioides taihuensis]|uniref:Alpha/beta hydrolase family protein n=1 Tax=Nocardioides taihuensis TaxID=1835606 RepID=A0ABW0BLM2_9ACTN
MRRRTFLGTAALGLLATACGEDSGPVSAPTTARAGRHAYGDDPSQFGELTLPDGDPRGVAVVVHGGFWKAQYGLEYAEPLVPSLVDAGWAVWAIEYRRVGNGGGVPTTLDDVAAAIDLLPDLGLDTSAVVAIGHSAGGHLATWAASRGRFDAWAGGVEVTHVVSQAGVLDLGAADVAGLGDGAVAAFLGHPYGPGDAPVDPVRQVPLDVPVWCVHGDVDDVVPLSQSTAYVDAATAAGATAELVRVDGDHFTVIDPESEAWATTLRLLQTI